MPFESRGREVSVVVPTIGRPELLAACVRSIAGAGPPPGEILVVDQSEGPEARAAAEAAGAGLVRVVACEGRGIALATNLGLREARFDTVLVTNDDCTVAADWVEVAWRAVQAAPGAIVSGKVLPGGEGAFVPSLRDEDAPREFTGERHFGALYAGNMVLDRRRVLALGGFDERATLRVAAEDNDLCYRWLRSGGRLLYDPALVVWHHDWRTDRELERRWREYARGQGALYAKHLHAGDRWIARRLLADLREAAGAELRGLLRREPRAADARRAGLYWLPVGVLEGWSESRRLARSGAPSSRDR